MSASSGGEGGQDFDLNLAPIIDCFTVLITYLLVSASFISLSALEVGVAAVGTAPTSPQAPPPEPPLNLSMKLESGFDVVLTLSGGAKNLQETFRITRNQNGRDYAALVAKLETLKTTWPAIPDVTVSADPSVSYKELVRAVEVTKRVVPRVFLAGQ